MDSFDNLPLACVINNQFLALHGGISPEMKTVINEYNLDIRCEFGGEIPGTSKVGDVL